MRLARQASGQRSFQTLPRHLRRRAASHVPRRVPTRLREKARFEMKNDKPKVLSKSVKRKLSLKAFKNQDRTGRLLERQVEKKWLRTHTWHAKRTKMVDLWGFRLARTPTEKCFRPTYRAARHGFTLHDLSYYIHLSLTAEEEILKNSIRKICDPTRVDPCSNRFKPGHRAAEIDLYSQEGWPSSLLGPATLLWRPLSTPTSLPKSSIPDPQSSETNHLSESPIERTVLLHIHPSIKDEVIESIKMASNNMVMVEEHEELGCLELGGPRSSEMIGRVLSGIEDDGKREVEGWLDAGIKPHAVPTGMVIGLTVDDPRLKFPPKKKKSVIQPTQLPQPAVLQPSTLLAYCDGFWDSEKRNQKMKFRKSELDKRRAALDIPGTKLKSTGEDDRISILLIRLGYGWRMFLPVTWTQAFFQSFIFSCARLICLDQRAQIDFESGRPSFPKDFPTLKPASELAEQQGSEEASYWGRKPPAKRVNYRLMDLRGGNGGDPFVPDWKVVIGQKGIQRNKRGEAMEENLENEGTCQKSSRPWLLIGPLLNIIVENVRKLASLARGKQSLVMVSELALQLVDQIVRKLRDELDWNQTRDDLLEKPWDSALVRVQLLPKGHAGKAGVIGSLARLYWNHKRDRADGKDDKELIGLVTTGSFALSKGASMGFGAISFVKLIRMTILQEWNSSNKADQEGERDVEDDDQYRPGETGGSRRSRMKDSKGLKFRILYRNKNSVECEPGQITLIG